MRAKILNLPISKSAAIHRSVLEQKNYDGPKYEMRMVGRVDPKDPKDPEVQNSNGTKLSLTESNKMDEIIRN